MSKSKKSLQLGMNPSTASGRLVKDILFQFVDDAGYKCYQCGGSMTRETFSIEHKEPWLDSENPVESFFNLDNITYSHIGCNAKAARRIKYISEEERKNAILISNRKSWSSSKRREYYKRTGK